jgi:hypothetical protein
MTSNIQLDDQKSKQEPTLHEQEVTDCSNGFRGWISIINLPILNKDIRNLDHLDFGAGFSPYLRGPYTTMYVSSLDHSSICWIFSSEENTFIDVILLQNKRTIGRFRFADTP